MRSNTSTAERLARSPWACPPMPSATIQKGGAARKLSSLLKRTAPTWLWPAWRRRTVASPIAKSSRVSTDTFSALRSPCNASKPEGRCGAARMGSAPHANARSGLGGGSCHEVDPEQVRTELDDRAIRNRRELGRGDRGAAAVRDHRDTVRGVQVEHEEAAVIGQQNGMVLRDRLLTVFDGDRK